MSDRTLSRLGWALVGLSACSAVVLQLALFRKLDSWNGLPFALLLYGALLPAMAAVGLSWRRGSPDLRFMAQLLAALMLFAWLKTWLTPLQDLIAWLRMLAYCWLGR